MTSPRRSRDRPVESVELKISFRADAKTAARIREAFPSAVLRRGGCELRIDGEEPGKVADEARKVLEKLRGLVEAPKDFKG
jgi:hypothetical protein